MSLRRWSKIIVKFLLVTCLLWLVCDFAYSRYVLHRIKQREESIERNESGVQLECESYHEGEGDEAILFVHGINDSPRVWRRLSGELADAGYYCEAIRLPGFAETTKEYASHDRFDWIDAVHERATKLREDHKQVHLVAHSLGAAVSLQVIARSPELFDQVTFIAPAINVSSARSPIFTVQTWHKIATWTLLFTWVTESPFTPDAYDPEEQKTKLRTPFTPNRTVTETFRLVAENQKTNSDFNKPLLLILSKKDTVIDNDAAIEFRESNPNATNKIYFAEKSGHSIPMDSDWKNVAEQIKVFLRETSETVMQEDEQQEEETN